MHGGGSTSDSESEVPSTCPEEAGAPRSASFAALVGGATEGSAKGGAQKGGELRLLCTCGSQGAG
eukprot:9990196-Alexandrium_andersonii.AAC.1